MIACHPTRAFYCTALGEVPMHSPLYMRAEYLDGWMRFNFIAGKLAGNPDLKSSI